MCRYTVAGIPTPTAVRQDSRSHPQLRHKGLSSRGPRVRLLPHRVKGPGPAPRSGTGPEMPRVPEEGNLRANSRGPGPPIGVRDLPRPSGPPTRVEPTYRRGGVRGATCPAGAGAGAGASLPLEDSPTHRIQCGWLRHALPPRYAGQSLSGFTVDRILPRYIVQPHALHPCRARLLH